MILEGPGHLLATETKAVLIKHQMILQIKVITDQTDQLIPVPGIMEILPKIMGPELLIK